MDKNIQSKNNTILWSFFMCVYFGMQKRERKRKVREKEKKFCYEKNLIKIIQNKILQIYEFFEMFIFL